MATRLAIREKQLETWTAIIQECRKSGITTKDRLAENNISKSSAIIYSLAETAKTNKLRLYEYFNYLLTEIPEHMDDKNNDFCEKLLPWSAELPAECRK